MSINANKALFIKLGEKGGWEKECFEKNYLKLGYQDINHDQCLSGEWDAAKDAYIKKLNLSAGIGTFHITQVKHFYEEGEDALWFTFSNNCLWWALSRREITYHSDRSKTRPTKSGWSNKDVNGKLLLLDNLRGTLLKTRGFRSTICSTSELDYLLYLINGRESSEVAEAKQAILKLEGAIEVLISKLQPKDFENLVDLIFRQAGWQRLGVVGRSEKAIDLDLICPIIDERAFIQIKSQSSAQEFEEYLNAYNEMDGYDRFIYIVHTPSPDLEAIADQNPRLMLGPKIASAVVKSGLADWVVKKSG